MEEKPGAVHLSLQINVLPRGGERRRLRPHESLRSGDRFAITVSVEKQAYVYVVQKFPHGPSAILFPNENEGDHLVAPGSPVSLPPNGEFFQLDEDAGEENIYVAASAQPLAQSDPELCKDLGLLRTPSSQHPPTAVDSKDPPSPPPPPPDPATGDGREPPGDGVARLHKGVALARFAFQHERRGAVRGKPGIDSTK